MRIEDLVVPEKFIDLSVSVPNAVACEMKAAVPEDGEEFPAEADDDEEEFDEGDFHEAIDLLLSCVKWFDHVLNDPRVYVPDTLRGHIKNVRLDAYHFARSWVNQDEMEEIMHGKDLEQGAIEGTISER